MSHLHSNSSSFTACFFPTITTTTNDNHPSDPPPPPPPPPPSPPPPAPISGKPNLSSSIYNTHLGLFSLTWSRTLFGHSLHLDLIHPFDYNSSPISSCNNSPFSHPAFSFHLHIKPFIFWKKYGSKKFTPSKNIQLYWDLSRAKFGSGPEPQSGFYIAVIVDGQITLLVGDSIKEAYAKTKAQKPSQAQAQALVLRREHVFGNRVYSTKAKFGGKTRDISIDCSPSNDAKLCFSVDNIRVLQIKRLKWKFRGNERIEVDGVPVQISWDVYNWLFDDNFNNNNNGNGHAHAVFMFRFEETLENNEEQEQEQEPMRQLQQSSCNNFGMSGIEWRKMRKSLMMRKARSSSSSSISMSSSSSGCSSSVMEWASMEESELSPGPNGFSLLVYVWKK